MLTLPSTIVGLMEPFAPALPGESSTFDRRTWSKAQLLVVGAILAIRQRTVTAALRVTGLSEDNRFAKYHHVLNRARWSPRQLSKVLLRLSKTRLGELLSQLDSGDQPLIFGIDETLERRWGRRIKAKGVYRDAVRSSRSHFVKASGLRWVSLMWLGHIPWAQRTWALPVLTILAPSERYYHRLRRPPKKLTDWARQTISQLRRWLPQRALVSVADSSYAVLELLHFCQSLPQPVTFITRSPESSLRPRRPGQMGRPRLKGKRLPTLKQVVNQPTTAWMKVIGDAPWRTVAWYDEVRRPLEVASGTAVWYHTGKPPVPIGRRLDSGELGTHS